MAAAQRLRRPCYLIHRPTYQSSRHPSCKGSYLTRLVVEPLGWQRRKRKVRSSSFRRLPTVYSTYDLSVYARKEVILSAGAIDSPKLLLLSGIGPRKELEKQNIAVIQNIPGIGKNLQDHLWLEIVTVQKPDRHHRTSYINNPAALEEARAEWTKYKSGPLADYFLPQVIAYLKSDRLLHSKEFQELDEATRKFLLADTIPHYELISVSPPLHSHENLLSNSTNE